MNDCDTLEERVTTILARSFRNGNFLSYIYALVSAFFMWLFPFWSTPDTYQLIDIPIVYHILRNQTHDGIDNPSLTDAQRDFATAQTNKLFEIYDRRTRITEAFVTFVTNKTVVHDTEFPNVDCRYLSAFDIADLVRTVDEFEFKFHVLVCKSNSMSGKASFPDAFSVDSALHNVASIDYRAFACHNEEGKFLCNLSPNGTQVSHTRWWRGRSVVVAHEFGHLFGLKHTFESGCVEGIFGGGGDDVADTPAIGDNRVLGCPGLLPYDKDRDFYSLMSDKPNSVSTGSCVAGAGVCGDACPACCNENNADCPLYENQEAVIKEPQFRPVCCNDNAPRDSCPLSAGIDPLNNVMSYIPDYCAYEFTPGQHQRMMDQTRQWKQYIYCNYANKEDPTKCSRVPCSSTATSPNCRNR